MGYYEQQTEMRRRVLRDLADHEMMVLQDDGVNRRILMKKPGTICYSFMVTTYPGYLIVTGDMGSWVFSRLHDMFEFHRIDWSRETPSIDYSYWHEKCQGIDRHVGAKSFDDEAFKEAIVREFRQHDLESTPWDSTKAKIFRRIRDELLDVGFSTNSEAINAAIEWFYINPGMANIYPFQEIWDYAPFEKHSIHFQWICWAIARTVQLYDRGGNAKVCQAAHDKLILEGSI